MFTFNFSEYLQHLDEAFLLFSLRRFSFELREQTQSNRKVYCTDNGLVTSASFRLSSDAGKLYENIIAIDLQKCAVEGALECYYWQGAQQEEVDFVVKQGTKVLQLIQVCLNLDDPKTKSREVRALVKAPEELKCKDLLILTDSKEGQETMSWFGAEGIIRYLPVWKWLLRNNDRGSL